MNEITDRKIMRAPEYAKYRGVALGTVYAKIKAGKLPLSSRKSDEGYVLIDVEIADHEWARNTNPQFVPDAHKDPMNRLVRPEPEPGTPDLHADIAREKHWKANLAELNFRREAGELVEASEVQAKMTDVFSSCRTRLLGIPSRARQALPHLSVPDIGVLENLIREALEELIR